HGGGPSGRGHDARAPSASAPGRAPATVRGRVAAARGRESDLDRLRAAPERGRAEKAEPLRAAGYRAGRAAEAPRIDGLARRGARPVPGGGSLRGGMGRMERG